MEPSISSLTGHGNIRVAVRVRPLPSSEQSIIEVTGKGTIAVRKEAATGGNEFLSSQQGRTEERTFDRVFGPDSTQAEVHALCCQPLVAAAVEAGHNATVFVYGATGAGKTHTMFGEQDSSQQGLIYRAIREVFAGLDRRSTVTAAGQRERTLEARVSFLELYNEKVYDLLQEANGGGGSLCSILEDERRGLLKIANLRETPVSSTEEALEHLHAGLQLRKVESTAANMRSSRSHAIFTLLLERVDETGERPRRLHSKISLIDLAGSERAAHTQNVGAALRDGAKINQSLLALANCINALGESCRKESIEGRDGAKTPQRKPPYRDSKLTLLLKSSLVSGGLVSMIANVHPGRDRFEDSVNTLEYAKRTSMVKAPVLVRKEVREVSITAANRRPTTNSASVLQVPTTISPPPSPSRQTSGFSAQQKGSGATSVTDRPKTGEVRRRSASTCRQRPEPTETSMPTNMDFTFAPSSGASGAPTASSRSGSVPPRQNRDRTPPRIAQRAKMCASPSAAEVSVVQGVSESSQNTTHCSGDEDSGHKSRSSSPLENSSGEVTSQLRDFGTPSVRDPPSGPPSIATGDFGIPSVRDPPSGSPPIPSGERSAYSTTSTSFRAPGPGRNRTVGNRTNSLPRAPQPAQGAPSQIAPSPQRQVNRGADRPGAEPGKRLPQAGNAGTICSNVGISGAAAVNAPKSTPPEAETQALAQLPSREVLLQIVESLQAEKAAIDMRLRSVMADRDRLEDECAELRSANLAKDKQLALLLAHHENTTSSSNSVPLRSDNPFAARGPAR